MERTFEWARGAVGPVDAQVAGGVLDGIIERRGALVMDDLVHEARPDDHPLHQAFEWADDIAAEAYRREQARYIVRMLRVVEEERQAPAYVNLVFTESEQPAEPTIYQIRVMERGETLPNRGWIKAGDAMADPRLRSQVLEDALGGIQAWRKRYAALSELGEIFAAIDATQMALRTTALAPA